MTSTVPRQDEAPETTSNPENPVRTVGLLADPGLPTKLAAQVARDLPDLLARRLPGRTWQVETAEGPVGLDAEGLMPMLRTGCEHQRRHGWDVVVIVTDLPRRAGTEPLVSDFGSDDGVGLVSVPALGAVGLRRRLRAAVVDLLAHGLADPTATTAATASPTRPTLLSPPICRIASQHEGIDSHLALTGTRGRLRLLAGMVRSNRPWRLVPSLSTALAAAAAGAAFGIFYSNIWALAGEAGPGRLALVAVLAVAAMSSWLVADNHLWEHPRSHRLRAEVHLYNAATTSTIVLGVVCCYALLLVLAGTAAVVVIPPSTLAATLGHPVGPSAYLAVASMATSMGIVAGAVGSGLTSPDAVRAAAYSTREQQRRARLDREDDRAAEGEQAGTG
ncbi:hypothetical protein Acsp06_30740 [Actinomycetospora sp. NBRC 106375]|uniref:hypothetical protein n=1 Tax=Actinomycetospora sp. NBRC 106375 TaxID=3032207 RepID=UPI0024A0A61F|nr:hypothetical protein [Actinomycetospora sp. NBRC 106375]GLZ46889.1 hypothetical protein Acsp06_30740 [Actinomycetospora sp. NBRC 106375]